MQFIVMSTAPNIERRADQIRKEDFNQLKDSLTSEFNKCRDKVKAAVANGDARLKEHDALHLEHKENFDRLFELAQKHDTRINATEQQIALLISSNQHHHVQADYMTGFIKSLSASLEANSKTTQSISDRVDEMAKNKVPSPSAKQVVRSGGFWTAVGISATPSLLALIAVVWFMLSGDTSLIEALK